MNSERAEAFIRAIIPELEKMAEPQQVYGFFHGGDPRDFTPDYDLCTPEEIARWQADVARAEAGENITAPPAGERPAACRHCGTAGASPRSSGRCS